MWLLYRRVRIFLSHLIHSETLLSRYGVSTLYFTSNITNSLANSKNYFSNFASWMDEKCCLYACPLKNSYNCLDIPIFTSNYKILLILNKDSKFLSLFGLAGKPILIFSFFVISTYMPFLPSSAFCCIHSFTLWLLRLLA